MSPERDHGAPARPSPYPYPYPSPHPQVHLRKVAARVRDRLLFAYGFKDTEPWPQFAQSLQIPREGTGAFWMILGNNMELTGRDWSAAWLRPPSLGFEIYAMQGEAEPEP